MNEALSPFRPGSQYGDYVLKERVGAGGAGEVWRAENVFTHVEVAMKFCHDADLRETLLNEAATLGEILRASADSGFPATVAKLIETHLSQDPPCIVMEFCAGGDLRSVLRTHGSLAPAEVVEIARQAARGLEWAHQRNILHRDIKPENLLLKHPWTPGGSTPPLVKVSDFGLGRVASTRALSIHRSIVSGIAPSPGPADDGGGIAILEGTSSGTIEYMSPEQMEGADVSPATDIYSLGVVIFELLTGRRPRGNVKLSAMVGGLSADWDELFERCYQYTPEQRFQSARELANFLESRFGVGGATSATRADARTRSRSAPAEDPDFDGSHGASGRLDGDQATGPKGTGPGSTFEKIVYGIAGTIEQAGQKVESWFAENEDKWKPGAKEGRSVREAREAKAARDRAALAREEAESPADADAYEKLRRRTRRNILNNWYFRIVETDSKASRGTFILSNDEGHHLAQWTHQEGFDYPDQPAPPRAARAEYFYRLGKNIMILLMVLLFIPPTASMVQRLLPLPGLSGMTMVWLLVIWVVTWKLLGDFFAGPGVMRKTRAVFHAFSNLKADIARVQESDHNDDFLEIVGHGEVPVGFLNKADWRDIGVLDGHGATLGRLQRIKRTVKVDGEPVKARLGFFLPSEQKPSAIIGTRKSKPVVLILADEVGLEARTLILNAAIALSLHDEGQWS